ncbi:hypothetical protein ACHQM5_008669 [Ranunculus cassubicifolius]
MSIESATDTPSKIPNHEGSSPDKDSGERSERRERPLRACTARSVARLNPSSSPAQRKAAVVMKKEGHQDQPKEQCSKIITELVEVPSSPLQLPRWNLRSMWELASILNFLNVFRPLLNITVEFSAEELETALITPNSTLDDIHIPLLKAIPPITRMALGRATWVTVLCRKLRDWWLWVAEGEIPIVASQGAEAEVYKALDPGIRVVILKALCDIRVEQEDIRNYIDGNVKHGIPLSLFRKERIGGDSHGISYWYEDDPIIGHRLYREIKKVEIKKVKTKGVLSMPTVTCQWETVATNLEEFEEVSEKLFSSKSRIEVAVGKKLKNDMLPEIEKIQKKKEKLLKKQHRQALLLESCYINADGIQSGRSLRDRKPVTYTFDDYDRSISEAIKITKKKPPSPEPPAIKREMVIKPEASTNGRINGRLHPTRNNISYDERSPKSTDSDETDQEEDDYDDDKSDPLDRSNRRRKKPERYSGKEFVEAVSDYEAEFDSDDDIVGEAVYDEEYLKSRKQRKVSSRSSSDGDEEEQSWDDEENLDEEEEEEEEEYVSSSDGSDAPHRSRRMPTPTSRSKRRETKLRSVEELQSGLRRSGRASRTQVNYRQMEISDSDGESTKHDKFNGSDEMEYDDNNENHEETVAPIEEYNDMVDARPSGSIEETVIIPSQQEATENLGKHHFLDLNELAPGTGFEDGPNMIVKDDARDDF